MGLTSVTLLVLAIVAAAGSLAAIVWAWPRLARPRPAHLAARLAAIAVSQLLVTAAFLIWLNSYFSFYATWGQLTGAGAGTHPVAARQAGASGRLVVIDRSQPGPAPVQRRAEALGAGTEVVSRPGALAAPATAGRLLQVTIKGERTGLSSGPGYVYLPPQYFQRAYARARFPVVLALTGYPGQATSIVDRLTLPAAAARLMAAGRVRPAVFVMLSVSPLFPLDTECTDVPGGPQVESFLALDVPRAIEQTFRVTANPAGWGALGYSTGGYCAAKLAMMYPDRFSAAVSMAGYYQTIPGVGVPHLWGGSVAYRLENSPDWRLHHLPAPPVSVLATSSWVGEKTLPGTLAFLRDVHPPMLGYSLIIRQGGHNFRTWVRELPPSLVWLSRRLS
jgi:enterochelin esterase-like enzyme